MHKRAVNKYSWTQKRLLKRYVSEISQRHLFKQRFFLQHPWMVSIGTKYNSSWYHYCGGAIVNQYTVISAAHCFFGKDLGFLEGSWVRVGSTQLKIEPIISYEINTIIKHHNYQGYGQEFDIAIIFTKRPIIMYSYVKPICLPSSSNPRKNVYFDRDVVLTGYGIDNTGHVSQYLRKANYVVSSSEECSRIYNGGQISTNEYFCAKSKVSIFRTS